MDKLYFATTNEGKIKEAREILGIKVEGIPLEIDEIQSLEPKEVAEKKAEAYFKEFKKPLFVEDVSLDFIALGRLPGVYIDSFSKELGNDGLIDLLKEEKDRSAIARTTICYIDGEGNTQVFVGEVEGTIATEQRGEKGFGWDPIFIPEGSEETFGEMEMDEKNNYSMRSKALKKFKQWFKDNK